MASIGIEELLFLLVWIIPLWIAWRFYQALCRIGSELAEIKGILRDRSKESRGE